MRKSSFFCPAFIFLIATYYGASIAVGQKLPPSSTAPMHSDEHDEHSPSAADYGDASDHAGHDHEQEHTEEESEDAHAGHDHGEEESEDAHTGHDEHGHEKEGAIRLSTEAMQDFGVAVEAAGPGTLDLHTTLPGEVRINQDRQAHIVPRYPGLVIEVKRHIGDGVQKGDVLAVLEGNESLAPYELKSLIDGTIIEKHITLGESLKEDDVVFTVADLDTVWIGLTIYQKDIAMVRPGQEIIVSGGNHLPTAKGTISYVSPTVDSHTRTGHARVVLPNLDGAWKPGLFVTGTILLDQVHADVVAPRTALQTIEGAQVVFIETSEGFEPRPVNIGRRNHDHVEILSGLRPGDRYVSRGGFTIKAEMARGELEHAGHAH